MRYTAAHEIGHWLLHEDQLMHRDKPMTGERNLRRSKTEAEADFFAACFLMPAKLLKSEIEETFGTASITFDEDFAFHLGLQDASAYLSEQREPFIRELAVASAESFAGKYFVSLAQRFRVSRESMAIRLSELQHALRDTKVFIEEIIRSGAEVGAFVAKPNSLNEKVISEIESLGIAVVREPSETNPPYSYFENSGALERILESESIKARLQGRKLVLVDVGGYFCKPLIASNASCVEAVAGIVEVTTFGHNRYVNSLEQLPVPVISVARSTLKQAESVYVGGSVVRAAEDTLQEAGLSLGGKTCVVVGYGMIGAEIARALQSRNLRTIVTDLSPSQCLLARLRNFETGRLIDVLEEAQLVFASTGTQSVSFHELTGASDGVILFSGGSRAQEFDVAGMERAAQAVVSVNETIKEFQMPWGSKIWLVNNGKAVNFLKDGAPEEIMDLVFAEIAASAEYLITENLPIGEIHELPRGLQDRIADTWLVRSSRRIGARSCSDA